MKSVLAGTIVATTIALLLTSLSVGTTQIATSTKVGFVEQQRVLTETQIGKRAHQQLKNLQKKKQAEIDRKEQELRELGEKIANEALPLTNEAREKLKRQQRKKKAELDIFISEAYDEADVLNRENAKKIQKLVSATAGEIARDLGYSVILERLGVVLYGAPEFDLTDEMIKRIDQKTEKPEGQAVR